MKTVAKRTGPAVTKVRSHHKSEKRIVARNIIDNVEKWSTDQKIEIIEAGVSKSDMEEVKKETGLDYETLAHILSVTKATLHSKKGNQKFNSVVSERILLLADIYAYGIEVFGEKDRFKKWLVSDIRALGNKRPVDLLHTFYGMGEVKDIIGRIAHGVYS